MKIFVSHASVEKDLANAFLLLLQRRAWNSKLRCVLRSELGGTLVRQMKGEAHLNSFIIPPFRFGDLTGTLFGVHSGSIVERKDLDVFAAVATALREMVERRPVNAA